MVKMEGGMSMEWREKRLSRVETRLRRWRQGAQGRVWQQSEQKANAGARDELSVGAAANEASANKHGCCNKELGQSEWPAH